MRVYARVLVVWTQWPAGNAVQVPRLDPSRPSLGGSAGFPFVMPACAHFYTAGHETLLKMSCAKRCVARSFLSSRHCLAKVITVCVGLWRSQ